MRPLAAALLLALLALAAVDPCPARAACDGRLVEGADVLGAPLCLPDRPRRIVVLDPTYSLGMALDLGLPVVGAPLYGMSDAALKERALAASVADIGHVAEPSLERIVGLAPDLILGSGALGEDVQRLASRFAPTALITAENWKRYFEVLAQVAGSETDVGALLAGYEARAAAIRARAPDIEVSVLRITSWDFQVYLDGPNAYAPFAVLREAGIRRTPYETTSDETTLKRPDWEQLAALDGDVLLYIVGGANPSDTDGRLEEVLANPLWQALPAVKAGRAYRVDPATWMEFSGIASAERVLDDVERLLLARP